MIQINLALKGTLHQPNMFRSFRSILSFLNVWKDHLGQRGLKTLKSSKFILKNVFFLRTKSRRTWGHESAAKGQEGCALEGKKAPRPHFWGQIQSLKGFLDPCDGNEFVDFFLSGIGGIPPSPLNENFVCHSFFAKLIVPP